MMKTAILLFLGALCPCVCSQLVDANSTLSGVELTTDITVNFTTGYRSAAALNAVYQSGLFNSPVARAVRERYHNCVEKDMNGNTTFPTSNDINSAFTIALQMPILLFLDVEVREGIMEAIKESLNRGGAQPPVDAAQLCIYRVQQYAPGTFNETVLVTIFRNDTVDPLVESFRNGYRQVPDVSEMFLGRNSWNLAVARLYPNLLPSGTLPASLSLFSPQNDLPEDPVRVRQHAFIIYSTSGYISLGEFLRRVEDRDVFVQNPNQINYYLEVGDYFFAIIGAFLVLSVLVLVFFGYVWNPLV